MDSECDRCVDPEAARGVARVSAASDPVASTSERMVLARWQEVLPQRGI